MLVKVDVTKNDINKGIRCSCSMCPIANAIRRTLNLQVGDVIVDNKYINYYHVNPPVSFILPPEARIFISYFDSNIILPESISFEIEIPNAN